MPSGARKKFPARSAFYFFGKNYEPSKNADVSLKKR